MKPVYLPYTKVFISYFFNPNFTHLKSVICKILKLQHTAVLNSHFGIFYLLVSPRMIAESVLRFPTTAQWASRVMKQVNRAT